MSEKFLTHLQIVSAVSLVLLSLSAGTLTIPSVRAATTGALFIDPPSQSAQPAGTTVTVQVKVANMPSFSSWEMAVKVNQSALNPVKIDVSGNVLTANYSLGVREFINCVNGSGVGCSIIDNPGVVHSGVAAAGIPPSGSLISGLLFKITYTAGSLDLSSILLFNYDISLAGNEIPHDAYSATNAIYGSGKLPVADFTWTPRFPFLGDNVTFDASASSDPNPKAVINSYFWDFQDPAGPPPPSSNPVQKHAFGKCCGINNPNGNQSIIFAVTLTVTDNITISNSKTAFIAVNRLPDFTISIGGFPGFGDVVQGMSITANVSISSELDFSGQVNLSAAVSPVGVTHLSLPVASVSPTQVELKPGGVNSSFVTVKTAETTGPGFYNLRVVGTSGSLFRSDSMSFRVVAIDFGIAIFPVPFDTISIVRGSSESALVTVTSLFGFSGTVSLTAQACVESLGFTGLTASLGASSVVLAPNGTVGLVLTISSTGKTPVGIRFCDGALIGTSGTMIHSVLFYVNVLSPTSPNFTFSITPPSLHVPEGSTRTSTITLAGTHGFSGGFSPFAFVCCGSGAKEIKASVSPGHVFLSNDGTASLTLTVSTTTSVPTGNYFVVILLDSEGPSSVVHFAIVEVRVPPSS